MEFRLVTILYFFPQSECKIVASFSWLAIGILAYPMEPLKKKHHVHKKIRIDCLY